MDYWFSHRPADIREYPEYRADRITAKNGIWPKDFLTNPRVYLVDYDSYDGSSVVKKLLALQGHPDMEVKIYRGDPSNGKLNTGDWVTLSKEYASIYAESGMYGSKGAVVHSYTVKASELSFDGDSIYEFGYWGPPQVKAG